MCMPSCVISLPVDTFVCDWSPPPFLPQDILTIRCILDAAGAQHVKVGCLLLLRVWLLVCLLDFVSACLFAKAWRVLLVRVLIACLLKLGS